MARNHASSAIDIRGADHGSALIDLRIGNDGKKGEGKGGNAALAFGIIEGDGDARSFVLFRPLLKIDDVADDDGTDAEMACGIVPIDSGLG
jgi:hypothetical protein